MKEEQGAEHERGYEVLNKSANYGAIGTSKRIHTDESIALEAQKYKTRAEFKKGSPKVYDAAVTQRILNRVCSHMRSINPKNYWTKDRCIEAASKYSNQDDFIKSERSAYSAARSNKWLEEVYEQAGLRAKNEMSWLRPATRKDIWCKANEYYQIWIQNDRCGMWRMRTITGENIDKMLKKFQSGWVPMDDKDWVEWSSQNKK